MLNQFNASLWGDEAFSAVLSMNSVSKIIAIIIKDTSPPLYNLTLHFWYQIFGTSEIAIRALSFLYYLLTIFFVYKIGTLFWSKKTGLIAAVVAFFNPFFFIYAFEGRMYSILALGVAASMYFFLKRNWVGYVIAAVWALYSHHFSIFALFVQGLWFIYEFLAGDKKTAKSMFKSFIAIFLLYIPWLYPLYKQVTMVGGGFWLGTPTTTDLRNLIYEYLAEGIKFPLNIPLIDKNLEQIALYLVFIILILRNWLRDIKKTLFLISWFLGPIILTWLVSQKFQSIFYNRYLLYTIPASMLVISSNRRKVSIFLISVLIALFAVIDLNYFTHPTKKPFSDLATYVKETQQEGDILINWSGRAHHLWETKYYGIPAPIYLPQGELPYYVGTAQMTDSDIAREIYPGTKRVVVITSDPTDEIAIAGYKTTALKSFGSLNVIWFSK
jgi:uncharacterized membrane protein